MSMFPYSRDQLVKFASLSDKDVTMIRERRRPYNQLGFAYQLTFDRLLNHFPAQDALDLNLEILAFVSA